MPFEIDVDGDEFDRLTADATALAEQLVARAGRPFELMQSSRDFDMKMRQATGHRQGAARGGALQDAARRPQRRQARPVRLAPGGLRHLAAATRRVPSRDVHGLGVDPAEGEPASAASSAATLGRRRIPRCRNRRSSSCRCAPEPGSTGFSTSATPSCMASWTGARHRTTKATGGSTDPARPCRSCRTGRSANTAPTHSCCRCSTRSAANSASAGSSPSRSRPTCASARRTRGWGSRLPSLGPRLQRLGACAR